MFTLCSFFLFFLPIKLCFNKICIPQKKQTATVAKENACHVHANLLINKRTEHTYIFTLVQVFVLNPSSFFFTDLTLIRTLLDVEGTCLLQRAIFICQCTCLTCRSCLSVPIIGYSSPSVRISAAQYCRINLFA